VAIAIGLIIGVISGIIQFILLSKFTGAITKGKVSNRTLLFALTQFLFPFAVLVVTAFFISDGLMWAGIGMGGALVTCAIAKFFLTPRSQDSKVKQKKK